MTVGTALSSAKCTFRRLSAPGRLSRGRPGTSSPSHRGAVGARPAGRAHSAAGSPAPGPSSFRERVGFQSNAHLPPARSTGNLRAHEGSGTGRRDPGMGETPETGPGAGLLPGPVLPRAQRCRRSGHRDRRGARNARRPTRGRPPRPAHAGACSMVCVSPDGRTDAD